MSVEWKVRQLTDLTYPISAPVIFTANIVYNNYDQKVIDKIYLGTFTQGTIYSDVLLPLENAFSALLYWCNRVCSKEI